VRKKIKVLHLPSVVGGNPQGLSKHLNQIGVESETWTLQQNYFGYVADKIICGDTDRLFWRELKRFFALRYVFKSDVVFFNFGQTLFQQLPKGYRGEKNRLFRLLFSLYSYYARLMQNLELFLLRVLKKVLLVQYQGDDARQGDYSLAHFPITIATQVEPGYYSAESDELKREQIQRLTGVCFKTYALNPDLLHVLPSGSEFLPYSHISLEEWSPCYTQMESRPLRIGHAPSHRGVKGTELILAALDALKIEGFEFELVLVEGLSNAEAKERYKTVDVLVDQLFAGWYGGLAVEAMALGKPVVVYIREEDLKFIPPEMAADLPFIQATPGSIESALRKVLEMPRAQLLELAMRSRAYVERWHDPVTIAKRIKADIEQALSSK
jgi:hypothetical protein